MRAKVNNDFGIAAMAIAAIALYSQTNSHNENAFDIHTLEPSIQSNPHTEIPSAQKILQVPVPSAVSPIETQKLSTKKLQPYNPDTTEKSSAPKNKINPNEQLQPQTPVIEPKPPEKITDEDAKKVIPTPFNLALGIFQENDRERYKEFSDAQLADDWDITMQAQLVDAIYSHPNANALTIDSVSCKAHLCELRVLATNSKTWPVVLADLRVQPWWDFGNNISIYEFGIKQDTQIKTVYFILLYKP